MKTINKRKHWRDFLRGKLVNHGCDLCYIWRNHSAHGLEGVDKKNTGRPVQELINILRSKDQSR